MYYKALNFMVEGVLFNGSRMCNDRGFYPNWKIDTSKMYRAVPPVKTINWPQEPSSVLRILHLSDIHLDPYYVEGAPTRCSETICCRNTTRGRQNSKSSGRFGDYSCDVPLNTVKTIFDYIKNYVKFDFIYWGGDASPHDDLTTNEQEKFTVMQTVYELLEEYFPGVKILPVVGNHESYPLNLYPSHTTEHLYPMSKLYGLISNLSTRWLDQFSAADLAR